MTNPYEFIPPRHEELAQVDFPYALRNDGLANTYFGPSGDIYIEPTESHDFAFSDQLTHAGLSGAMVVERDGLPHYLRFNGGSDLISLPAALNVAIGMEDGLLEAQRTIRMTGELLAKIRKQYHVVPNIASLDGVAIDRLAERAELMPPYHVTAGSTVTDVLTHIYNNAMSRVVTQGEASLIAASFAPVFREMQDK